ncbi:hypothetical protein pb186bvf_018102 [Paramecium bursaria]
MKFDIVLSILFLPFQTLDYTYTLVPMVQQVYLSVKDENVLILKK